MSSSSTTITSSIPSVFSIRNVLAFSIIIRVVLILYSEWHDSHSLVKYTDVDYLVFTDAARFLLRPGPEGTNHAQGPAKQIFGHSIDFGDPYSRATYRYTPLLAVFLTPNIWLHPSFGKYLFAACDVINGGLIYNLLLHDVLPSVKKKWGRSGDPTQVTVSQIVSLKRQAAFYSAFHLLNPLVFSISTRGSSEAILSLLVLLALHAVLKKRWNTAAILLGVSTHWKIYPVIYVLACLGVVGTSPKVRVRDGLIKALINWNTIKFGVLSSCTFGALGAGCYAIWGYPFLYESYLYHLHRLDHRHNFSPYFYLTYLTYPSLIGSSDKIQISLWSRVLRSPLTSFVPQMMLVLGTGLLFGRRSDDLVFTWFIQTCVFVIFNKVCTSQYFLWYLLLLPLLLPKLSISRQRAITCILVWIGTQALWLGEAYKLEFLGDNTFFGLWIRSLIYVVGNCWVLISIMDGYCP